MTIPMVRLTDRKERPNGGFVPHASDTVDYIINGNSVASKLAFVEDILDNVLFEGINDITNQAEKALKVLELFQPLIDITVRDQRAREEYELACLRMKG